MKKYLVKYLRIQKIEITKRKIEEKIKKEKMKQT